MKTINTYILAGTLLLAGAFLTGCSKATDSLQPEAAQKPEAEEEILTPKVPQGPNEFILKVRSSIDTKALTDLGETLGSEWTQGDSVRVYNVTTEEMIEGFLFAEADGTSTTFSGTVAGNFNQGDVLRLLYLSPNNYPLQDGTLYTQQDGTLEGVASKCDYAVADVEILEIDPEAKTITTEVAEFVKQQSVVKFNLTNRKDPVEDLYVKNFLGYYELPGTETPFGILVKPAAATNELYVAIPYLDGMKITFEAEGADGYYYRLIVPSVTFEDGLYYRRTLNMKRKALVKAPVAKTNLKYTSQPLALVDSAHVYWIVNNQEVILDDDKDYQEQKCVISYFVKKEVTEGAIPTAPTATENGWVSSIPTQIHAGAYYVWTKMTGNYDYEDVGVCTTPVKVEIAKAESTDVTITANAASGTLTYSGSAQNLLASAATLTIGANNVTSAKDTSNTSCTIQYYVSTSDTTPTGGSWSSSYSATNAGTYYIWIKVTGNGDIEDKTQVLKATKEIKKANWNVSAPTAISGLVYNGTSQNLCSAGSASGVSGQTGELEFSFDDGNSYGSNRAKTTANYGNARTIYWRTKANSNYNQSSGSITATMQRKQGWCSVSPTSNYFDNHSEICNITISCHGGSLSHNSQYYDVNFNGTTSGTIQHKSSSGSNWVETITITSGATENYTSASCTFACS